MLSVVALAGWRWKAHAFPALPVGSGLGKLSFGLLPGLELPLGGGLGKTMHLSHRGSETALETTSGPTEECMATRAFFSKCLLWLSSGFLKRLEGRL